MRRALMSAGVSIVCVLLLEAGPAAASTITVQWRGPSAAAWQAAEADRAGGGPGTIPDTDFFQGCTVVLGPFCHYVWNQGLAAGGSFGLLPPELFVDEFGAGFGLNVIQSMPSFFIYPECKPGAPCYSTFTPLSIDWDFYGGTDNLAPFVWFSSKGGQLVVDGDWDGHFAGALWQDVAWIQGVYGCLDEGGFPDLICTDDFDNPFIRGMTIEAAVPEPPLLALFGVFVLIGAFARSASRVRQRPRITTVS